MKMTMTELEKKWGSVVYECEKYVLTDGAEFTGRCLPDPYQQTHFELSAPAIDNDGHECVVYWIFEEVKDWELDQYDYDDVDRIEVV